MNTDAPSYDELFEKAREIADAVGVDTDKIMGDSDGWDLSLRREISVPNLDIELQPLEEMEEIDNTVFPKWEKADLWVMFAAGVLGAFSSKLLNDYFGDLHNAWNAKPAINPKTGDWQLGHGGERIDRVPGISHAGTKGHRWKFGHDLFKFSDLKKPFDANDPSGTAWNQYLEMAEKLGLPKWAGPILLWFSHLLQDMFSREGMIIPRGSYLYDLVGHPKLLSALATIKARDIVGCGVTNLIMGAYLGISEHSLSRVVVKANYRCFSLMLGANVVALAVGVFPPLTSLNLSTIPVISYYAMRIALMEHKIRGQLRRRDDALSRNEFTLESCYNQLVGNQAKIDEYMSELRLRASEIDEAICRADAAQRRAEETFNSLKKGC